MSINESDVPRRDGKMDVGEWLRILGLGEYEALFRENHIDAEVLNELTEADLEKLGVSLGHRKRLLRAIAAHNAPVSAPLSPPRRVPLSPRMPPSVASFPLAPQDGPSYASVAPAAPAEPETSAAPESSAAPETSAASGPIARVKTKRFWNWKPIALEIIITAGGVYGFLTRAPRFAGMVGFLIGLLGLWLLSREVRGLAINAGMISLPSGRFRQLPILARGRRIISTNAVRELTVTQSWYTFQLVQIQGAFRVGSADISKPRPAAAVHERHRKDPSRCPDVPQKSTCGPIIAGSSAVLG
jgi:hypothetical protein